GDFALLAIFVSSMDAGGTVKVPQWIAVGNAVRVRSWPQSRVHQGNGASARRRALPQSSYGVRVRPACRALDRRACGYLHVSSSSSGGTVTDANIRIPTHARDRLAAIADA